MRAPSRARVAALVVFAAASACGVSEQGSSSDADNVGGDGDLVALDGGGPADLLPGGNCNNGVWTGTPAGPYAGRYAGLETLCGPELARRLCALVTEGYRGVDYTQARQIVFRNVDDHAGRVTGVYDGLSHDPAHSEINIEHTWPQSRGAVGLAKSDMHHLFPTRADYNSARSNLPLGEVEKRTWPTTLVGDPGCVAASPGPDGGCYSFKGTDKAGVVVFEPRDGQKGVSARAIFYFAVRYGQNCATRRLADFDPTHPIATEAVLKSWNQLHPPEAHESARNDRVEGVEKVRNPFIDHPELVERISFQ